MDRAREPDVRQGRIVTDMRSVHVWVRPRPGQDAGATVSALAAAVRRAGLDVPVLTVGDERPSAVPEAVVVVPAGTRVAPGALVRLLASLVAPGREVVRVYVHDDDTGPVAVRGREVAEGERYERLLADDETLDAELATGHAADDGRWRHWVDGSDLGFAAPAAAPGSEEAAERAHGPVPRLKARARTLAGRRARLRQRAVWRRDAQPR